MGNYERRIACYLAACVRSSAPTRLPQNYVPGFAEPIRCGATGDNYLLPSLTSLTSKGEPARWIGRGHGPFSALLKVIRERGPSFSLLNGISTHALG